jgi:predicted DNA-binding protein (MmcQ/YjbR family)
MFVIYPFPMRPEWRASSTSRSIAERFLELAAVPGVTPAPSVAPREVAMPVQHPHGPRGPWALDELVRRSHALVAAGLTKKLQRELGLL